MFAARSVGSTQRSRCTARPLPAWKRRPPSSNAASPRRWRGTPQILGHPPQQARGERGHRQIGCGGQGIETGAPVQLRAGPRRPAIGHEGRGGGDQGHLAVRARHVGRSARSLEVRTAAGDRQACLVHAGEGVQDTVAPIVEGMVVGTRHHVHARPRQLGGHRGARREVAPAAVGWP